MKEFAPFFTEFVCLWYMPTVEEYKNLADSSPFRNVRIWGENADHFFTDAESMIRWIDQPSLVPFLVHVADPAKDAFRDIVVNEMVDASKPSAVSMCQQSSETIESVLRNIYHRAGSTPSGLKGYRHVHLHSLCHH